MKVRRLGSFHWRDDVPGLAWKEKARLRHVLETELRKLVGWD